MYLSYDVLFIHLFQLKPYVTYKVPYVEAKPITAQEILDVVQPTELVMDQSDNSKDS